MNERVAPECGCTTEGKIVRGMCAVHYHAWLHVTPKDQRPAAPRFIRSFWDFVDKSGDCWIWTGPKNGNAYGYWSGEGIRGLAHRVSLNAVSPCPSPGLLACHSCDNPPCVNPAHLYWGTNADNTRDMIIRGRRNNQNSLKTHCKRGHEFAGDNLLIVGRDRRRQCKTCVTRRRAS